MRSRSVLLRSLLLFILTLALASQACALSLFEWPSFPTPGPPQGLATPTAIRFVHIADKLAQIDQILKDAVPASIAYSAPQTIKLEETVTITLLLNPSVGPEDLGKQVNELGQVMTTNIEITPRMKAVLVPREQDAFLVQPLHDSPEQFIGSTETTVWSWDVTAKKGGMQSLTLIIFRLITIDGNNDWRVVGSYRSEINVNVTFMQWLQSLDWKWIASFILALVGSTLGVLTWRNNRNKEPKQEKSKEVKPMRNIKKTRK